MKFRLRRYFIYYIGRVIAFIFTIIPVKIGLSIASALGRLVFYALVRYRKLTIDNLKSAFGNEKSETELKEIAKRVFQNLSKNAVELVNLPKFNKARMDKFVRFRNRERLEKAYENGKGIIVLTAHFGNWELGSFAHGVYGYPCAFIVREFDNPLLDELIGRYRCLSGGRAIEKRDFAREGLRAFERGEAVGVLIDQNMLATEGAFVDFLGRLACTATGPARLARKTGVPIVLGLVLWDSKIQKYRLRFDAVEWIKREDPEEEILVNTANFTRLIEDYVRRYPDQWLWVHRRWKTRPPGERPLYPF